MTVIVVTISNMLLNFNIYIYKYKYYLNLANNLGVKRLCFGAILINLALLIIYIIIINQIQTRIFPVQ